MRALASGDQRRRRPTPVITSMRCKPSGAPSSRSVVGWSVLPCRCLLMRTHYGPCRTRPGRWEGITGYTITTSAGNSGLASFVWVVRSLGLSWLRPLRARLTDHPRGLELGLLLGAACPWLSDGFGGAE